MRYPKNSLIVMLAALFMTVGLASSCKSTAKSSNQTRIVEVKKKTKIKSNYNRRNKRKNYSKQFGTKKGDDKLLEKGRKARFASSLDSW